MSRGAYKRSGTTWLNGLSEASYSAHFVAVATISVATVDTLAVPTGTKVATKHRRKRSGRGTPLSIELLPKASNYSAPIGPHRPYLGTRRACPDTGETSRQQTPAGDIAHDRALRNARVP